MTATTQEARHAAPAAPGSAHPLAGTRTLVRFILRRDRIKLPAWLLGLLLLGFYYGTAVPEAFGDSLEDVAVFLEGPVGGMFGGPGYGDSPPTVAQFVAGVYVLYFLILAAIMNILLVSRHTRVEEQTGRAELVRASVVGRYAPLTAVLLVAVVANVLLSLLVGLAMISSFDGAGDGLLVGAGTGAVGLVFAAVAAVTMQVTEYSRAASGLAGAALGVAFVIRAAGDMLGEHGSALSWFSPLAWSQQTRPYADGRWWPLLLSLGLVVVLAAVAYALQRRRDLGAGLVAARGGSPVAAPWLRSPLAYAFRLQRAALIGWGAALGISGFLFGAITEEMVAGYEGLEGNVLEVLGGDAGRLTDGYLSVMGLFMATMVGIFAILGVQLLRTEETRGRAEPVLATATSRWAWFGSHLAVLAAGAVGLLLVIGLATGAGTAIVTGEISYLWDVTVGHVSFAPAVLVFLAVAALLFGVLPRAIGATWALLGYAMFLGFVGALLDLPQLAYNVSPLDHIAQVPLEDFTLPPVLILTLIAAVVGAVGLAAFRRRDLTTK